VRVFLTYSTDEIATGPGPNEQDTSGANFNDVDLAFWGAQGPYTWRISADIDNNEGGSSTSFELEDAWVRWNCAEYFDAQIGNMKPRVSRSNSIDPEKQLFIDRSALGSAADSWDNGFAVTGRQEQLFWGAWVMNGFNGHESDHLYVLRAEFDLGSGAGEYEGAMGSSDTLNATGGITFLNDDASPTVNGDSDTSLWLLDFHGNVSQVGFGFEVASLDDDFGVGTPPTGVTTDEDFSNLFTPLNFYGDTTPWSIYGSYSINPEWEVAVRYEDLDNSENNAGLDAEDNTILSVGANYYRGTNAKWQAQYSMFDADSSFPDGDVFEVGVVIGATR
jgi:hypothetical protein